MASQISSVKERRNYRLLLCGLLCTETSYSTGQTMIPPFGIPHQGNECCCFGATLAQEDYLNDEESDAEEITNFGKIPERTK